jgi:hypothetical protein
MLRLGSTSVDKIAIKEGRRQWERCTAHEAGTEDGKQKKETGVDAKAF